MNIVIIISVSLLALLLFVGTAVFVMVQNENKKKKQKISVIRGKKSESASDGTLEETLQNKRRAEIAKKLKEEGVTKKRNDIEDLLQQAGLNETSVKQFWLYSFVFCIFATVITLLMGLPHIAVLMIAIISLFGLPRVFLKKKIARRQKKFLEEFPDALEAMVRLLKAGMPVSEAILMASKEFTGPVGDEMSRIYDSQKIGVPLSEATLEAARRMPITEMQMFATGIAIQAQTGASLSEVLLNLSGVIRSRFRLKRKVQALSSEAKASAMIIGALPVLVGLGLYFINKDFIMLLFITNMGRIMFVGGLIWMSIGIFMMKAMINFRV